jgi:hypothetical protein
MPAPDALLLISTHCPHCPAVLLEEFAGSDALRALLPRLGELSQHADAWVRADACHYLGLTGDAAARTWLQSRVTDEDAEVREIAAESLQDMLD